ncbi:hypothetical protein ACFL6I_26265 [candidate division KSB1 bacterium]
MKLNRDTTEYAKEILGEHRNIVNFINNNVLRFLPDKQYDLIWSAGL